MPKFFFTQPPPPPPKSDWERKPCCQSSRCSSCIQDNKNQVPCGGSVLILRYYDLSVCISYIIQPLLEILFIKKKLFPYNGLITNFDYSLCLLKVSSLKNNVKIRISYSVQIFIPICITPPFSFFRNLFLLFINLKYFKDRGNEGVGWGGFL